MTITATFVRFMPTDEFKNARLYRLSEAVPYDFWGYDEDEPDDRPLTDHVIVSAVHQSFGPLAFAGEFTIHETMTFPATHRGEVASWTELGCTRYITDHDQALRNMGYEVVIELPAFCEAVGAQARQDINNITIEEPEDA